MIMISDINIIGDNNDSLNGEGRDIPNGWFSNN